MTAPPTVSRMARVARWLKVSLLALVLIVVVVVLVGGLILLSSRAHDKPQTRIEKGVSLGNLQG